MSERQFTRSHAHRYQASYVPFGLDHLRAVLFRENTGKEFCWVVIGLEKDIGAQGKSPMEAVARFERVLAIELEMARIEGKSIEKIGPSPKLYHDLYDVAAYQWT